MAKKRPGPYVGLSANYADDEKIMAAGEDAELLYIRMLAYCARTPMTEGWVSEPVLKSRLGITERTAYDDSGKATGNVTGTDALSRAETLLEVGLIQRDETGYRITSWLRWNRSIEEMGKERQSDRTRKSGLTSRSAEQVPEKGPEKGPEPVPENPPVPTSNDQDQDQDQDQFLTGADASADPATEQTAQTLIGEWIDNCSERPPGRVIGQLSKEIKTLLDEGQDYQQVRSAVQAWNTKGTHPSVLPSVLHELRNKRSQPPQQFQSASERRAIQGMNLVEDELREFYSQPQEIEQ